MLSIAVVIQRHFPDFYQKLSGLPDYRSRPRYQVRELIVSGLLMFLFRSPSRNQADNIAKNLDFQDNIMRVFGVRVADMDTVDRYLRLLPPEELEAIKLNIIRELIKSKVFHKYRYKQLYYNVTIDGSGMQSYDYEPYPGCPYKTYKSGKKVWTTYVLESKLITSNGFALSLLTEWIENPTDKDFNKQDSEHKALLRLTKRLKKEFPRLPVLLLLDGLYPNNTVFTMVKDYSYKVIVTLKDKSLKSVQEQVADKRRFNDYISGTHVSVKHQLAITQNYKLFSNIQYKEHLLNVLEAIETQRHIKTNEITETRFVHITNDDVAHRDLHMVSLTGRLRWKIENEGFNIQKTKYFMEHKFSRTNFNATKNYYNLLQIAEIISQLTFKLKKIQQFVKQQGLTISGLVKTISGYFCSMELSNDDEIIKQFLNIKIQLRY
jgi:hypothetical protein